MAALQGPVCWCGVRWTTAAQARGASSSVVVKPGIVVFIELEETSADGDGHVLPSPDPVTACGVARCARAHVACEEYWCGACVPLDDLRVFLCEDVTCRCASAWLRSNESVSPRSQ